VASIPTGIVKDFRQAVPTTCCGYLGTRQEAQVLKRVWASVQAHTCQLKSPR
jgi:hypothetical protein